MYTKFYIYWIFFYRSYHLKQLEQLKIILLDVIDLDEIWIVNLDWSLNSLFARRIDGKIYIKIFANRVSFASS